jgi:hypothetical protein
LSLAFGVAAWAADPTWQVRLQYIEACSCNLFCPCYFNKYSAHKHDGQPRCTFNMATRVLTGKHGDTDLTGMKFWLAGDLGPDWATKGQAEWLVVTFEPKATKEQKDGLMAVLSKIYPVSWKSVEFDASDIEWTVSPDGRKAHAKTANGKGEVTLTRFDGTNPKTGAQIQNVKYFGATWNSPFTLYHSDHYFKGFGKSYELKEANGFMITVEHTSDGRRVPAAPKKAN